MKNKHVGKLCCFLLIHILSMTVAKAQNEYKTALGVRINGGAGITVRHNLNKDNSLEGILYTRWGGFMVTGLYQVNYPVFTEPGFRLYFGGGAHMGVWNGRAQPWWDDDKGTHGAIGVDGQLGLEYTFDKVPLNLSLDWKPAFNIIGVTNFWAEDLGLSVRYAIK